MTFYVWLSDTDLSVFTKDTFMNLCNFSEKLHAKNVIFLLDREHKQKNEYRSMFNVIDASRLGVKAVTSLLKTDSDEDENDDEGAKLRAENVIASVAFYKFVL